MQDLGVKVLFEGANFSRLMEGLWITGRVALISIVISCVLGIIFGIIMSSKNKLIWLVSKTYLEAIRIIPILVWLFLFYFGLTKALNIDIDAEVISIVVFSMWGIAEMGDIVRGAITSLPRHQIESGKSLGLTKIQIYYYVLIPQAVQRLAPAAINLVTRMIKTTSLIVLIGVVEMVKVGQQIIEASILTVPSASFWVYGFIFFLYFIICYPISLYSKKLEEKWEN